MSAPAIPQSDLGERIVAAVRDAKSPVTFNNLAKLVKAKAEPLRAALESAVGAGHVHRWPGRSQCFWNVSAEETARNAVLMAAATQALSKTGLIMLAAKKLPGFSAKRVQSVVSALVAENRLQKVPAFASSSKLYVRTGDREAYFNAARAFVDKKIRAAGFGESLPPPGPLPVPDDAAPLILDAVRFLEPVRGVPVSTLRLRNHLPHLTKHEFDVGALELRRKEQVFLSQHVDPYNISRQEKDLLIDGQDGTYYVAIAIR
jgi:hypothetical protein